MSALRKARVDARLSVDELSVKSGISPEQIRNIESGRARFPRPATLGKLADALSTEEAPVAPSDLDPFVKAA